MLETPVTRRDAMKLIGRTGMLAVAASPVAALLAACSSPAASVSSPGASGSGAPSAAAGDTIGRFKQQGFVRIGYEEAAPYSYVDPKTGSLTGLDIEITRAIFKTMGLPDFDPVLTVMTAYIPGLLANRWDFTGNSIYLRPERCAQVAFTNPLHVSIETALVRKGNPKKISSWQGIVADPSIKIGIGEGSNDQALYKQDGVPDSRVSVFPDDQTSAQAVADGRVDVWLNDILSLNWMIKTIPSIGDTSEVITAFTPRLENGQPQKRYLGVACRYDEIDFLNGYNAALKDMITSGQLLTIGAPFGLTKEIVPDPAFGAKGVCPDGPWPSNYKG
jgi:polar amino acid transport system substrate-binding protein